MTNEQDPSPVASSLRDRRTNLVRVRIAAARTPHQTVAHELLEISPEMPRATKPGGPEFKGLVRLTVAEDALDISYSATVTVAAQSEPPYCLDQVPFDEIPADVMPYLNPSRSCESDRLGDFAYRLFGDAPPETVRSAPTHCTGVSDAT